MCEKALMQFKSLQNPLHYIINIIELWWYKVKTPDSHSEGPTFSQHPDIGSDFSVNFSLIFPLYHKLGAGLGIFLLTPASGPALGLTQLPIQRVAGVFSLGVKQPGCEANQSPPSSAKVKNAWSFTSTPQIHLHGMLLS